MIGMEKSFKYFYKCKAMISWDISEEQEIYILLLLTIEWLQYQFLCYVMLAHMECL